MLSCVKRAVWIIEAEAGGLQLWEKGGRWQGTVREDTHPLGGLWVEALKPVQVQVTLGLESQNNNNNNNNRTGTNWRVAWDTKEKNYSELESQRSVSGGEAAISVRKKGTQ